MSIIVHSTTQHEYFELYSSIRNIPIPSILHPSRLSHSIPRRPTPSPRIRRLIHPSRRTREPRPPISPIHRRSSPTLLPLPPRVRRTSITTTTHRILILNIPIPILERNIRTPQPSLQLMQEQPGIIPTQKIPQQFLRLPRTTLDIHSP